MNTPDPTQGAAFDKLASQINNAAKATEHLGNVSKKMSKEMEKNFNLVSKEVGDVQSQIDGLNKDLKDMAWEEGLPVKQAVDFANRLSKINKRIDTLKKAKGPFKREDLDKQKKTLDSMMKRLFTIKAQMVKALPSSQKVGRSFSEMGEGIKDVGSMWRAVGSRSPRQLKDTANQAGRAAEGMKEWGSLLSKSGKGFAVIGGAVKGMGGAIGGISKLLGGWPGLVLMALKAVWDLGMAADRFVKKANKIFASIRGPDIMTGDVKKQFKEFNKAVYDIGANIQTGLLPEQVQEFFSALQQAGTNLDRVTKGFGTYRDAVYMAAKASKTLGLDMPQVGAMISNLMNNFKMQMKDIDDLFVQTAFSAQKAGVSTDKFWTAVTNANASLAFYGVNLQGTSKMLQKFAETGVEGFEDTSKTVTDLTQTFKGMSMENRAAFSALVKDPKAVKKLFAEARKKMEKELEQVNVQIQTKQRAMVGAAPDEQKKIADEIDTLNDQTTGMIAKLKMISEGEMAKNSVAQAEYLPVISGNIVELIDLYLKNNGIISSVKDLSGTQLVLAERALKAAGVNEDLVIKLKNYSKSSYEDLKKILGVNESGVNATNNVMGALSKLDDEQRREFSKNLRLAKGDSTELEGIVSGLGIQGEDAGKMVRLLSDPSFASEIANAIESNGNDINALKSSLVKAFNKTNAWDKEIAHTTDANNQVQESLKKNAAETFKKVVDQTLSYDEITKITKDGLTYELASIGLQEKLNGTVFNIYKLLLNTNKTPAQKEADLARKKAGLTGGGISEPKRVAKIFKDMQFAIDQSAYFEEQIKKAQDKGDKKQIEELKKGKKVWDTQVGIDQKQLDILTKESEINQKTLAIQQAMFRSDKKAVGEQVAELLDQGKTAEEVREELQISSKTMMEGLDTIGRTQEYAAKVDLRAIKAGARLQGYVAPSAEATTVTKAGLITPYTVKKQAQVMELHRGETVTGRPGIAGGGAGNNISISVNATEKDLAQRIANEVRGILYQQGMGR